MPKKPKKGNHPIAIKNNIEGPDDFCRAYNISRETRDKFETYAAMLRFWQKSKNLVSEKTLQNLWQRHFADCAQLIELAPKESKVWLDLGSGAGLPGIVIALLLADPKYILEGGAACIHLVESNSRKTAFLREIARKLELTSSGFVEIHNCRIETLAESAQNIDVNIVTARALAQLKDLLEFARPFIAENTTCLFLKGRGYAEEIREAQKHWHLSYNLITSRTDPEGKIIKIKTVSALEQTKK